MLGQKEMSSSKERNVPTSAELKGRIAAACNLKVQNRENSDSIVLDTNKQALGHWQENNASKRFDCRSIRA